MVPPMLMLDPLVAAAGFGVGFVVGLTGMGGGALMTPILVLLFGVEPLAAVSSDLLAAVVMKPVGGLVHWRQGTVQGRLVLWLMLGSVPAAFLGVVVLKTFGSGEALQVVVKSALGVALLVVVLGLLARPLLQRKRGTTDQPFLQPFLEVARLRTLAIGVVGGLVVGITSVGSGSLMIVMLLMLYPGMRLSQMVGTDLVQAIPLVASAALAHLIFGHVHFDLTASILVGSIPGVFLGARFSARGSDRVIRPALMITLAATGLKLLGTPTVVVGAAAAAMAAVALACAVTRAQRSRREEVLPPGEGVAAALPDGGG